MMFITIADKIRIWKKKIQINEKILFGLSLIIVIKNKNMTQFFYQKINPK